jgi:hypothetical protein
MKSVTTLALAFACGSILAGDSPPKDEILNTAGLVMIGDKAAFTNPGGDWLTPADAENERGPGQFMAGHGGNFKAPAAQGADLSATTKERKKDGDVFSGELTEDETKSLRRFRRGGGGEDPTISGARGTVKFWLKNGVLTKYEFKVTGKIDFSGNEFDVNRAATLEIKVVDTTKGEVSEAAKEGLS